MLNPKGNYQGIDPNMGAKAWEGAANKKYREETLDYQKAQGKALDAYRMKEMQWRQEDINRQAIAREDQTNINNWSNTVLESYYDNISGLDSSKNLDFSLLGERYLTPKKIKGLLTNLSQSTGNRVNVLPHLNQLTALASQEKLLKAQQILKQWKMALAVENTEGGNARSLSQKWRNRYKKTAGTSKGTLDAYLSSLQFDPETSQIASQLFTGEESTSYAIERGSGGTMERAMAALSAAAPLAYGTAAEISEAMKPKAIRLAAEELAKKSKQFKRDTGMFPKQFITKNATFPEFDDWRKNHKDAKKWKNLVKPGTKSMNLAEEAWKSAKLINSSALTRAEKIQRMLPKNIKDLKAVVKAGPNIASSLARSAAPYLGAQAGEQIGLMAGGDEGAAVGKAVGRTAGDALFLSYLARHGSKRIAKILPAAWARHAASAGTGWGAHPGWQLALVLLDIGVAASEVWNLYRDWKKVANFSTAKMEKIDFNNPITSTGSDQTWGKRPPKPAGAARIDSLNQARKLEIEDELEMFNR